MTIWFFCAGGFETLLVWWSCLVERQFYFQELRFVSVGWLDSKLLFRLAELIGSTGSCRSGDCIVSFVRGEGRSWRFQVSLSEFIITLWLCQNSYWTWPFNAIYSWFTNETWWFFIVFCMFTRGYILIQFFMGYPLETCTDTSDSFWIQDFDRFCSLHAAPHPSWIPFPVTGPTGYS